MPLLIIGIVVMALSAIGAAFNVGSAVRSGFRNPDSMFEDNRMGNTFGRQAIFAAGMVIGLALVAIGIVLLVV